MSSQDNLGRPITGQPLPPEGGNDDGMNPTTVNDPNHVPVATGRDVQSDARTMNDVGSGNIMDDRDLDDTGYLLDLNASSLGTEKRRGGWIRLATPSGGPPAKATTAGTRGAEAIREIPDDGSMP